MRDLETEIAAFIDRRPYEAVAEEDRETGDRVFRLRISEEVPATLSGIIGDVVHNLRSAFDLLAADIVTAGGGKISNSTEFPVSYAADHFKSKGALKIQGATKAAQALAERFQPYHAGNEALAQIHKLDILDKHRAIIPVGSAQHGFDPGISMKVPWQEEFVKVPAFFLRPADRGYPLKDGAILLTEKAAVRSPDLKNDYKFAFDIAFGEGQVVDGQPIVPTVAQFVEFTERVLDTFQRELFEGVT